MKKLFIVLIVCAFTGLMALFGIDFYVRISTDANIKTVEELKDYPADFDCIVILGAGLKNDGTPSPMLKERLDKGIELYEAGLSQKIIMSGDHEFPEHDEVNAMKTYAIEQGVPSKDIFMDHTGLSTYDSMYRTKDIFGAEKVFVVTQKYHLYRALYIGKSLDLEIVGVDAEKTKYNGTAYRESREFLARIKDFFKCVTKPESLYGGKAIPVNGDGNVTNDKDYITIENNLEKEKKIYISRKSDVKRIKDIVETGKYKKGTCEETPQYTIKISTGDDYDVIVSGEKIIIRKKNREFTLEDDDAEYMRTILKR